MKSVPHLSFAIFFDCDLSCVVVVVAQALARSASYVLLRIRVSSRVRRKYLIVKEEDKECLLFD